MKLQALAYLSITALLLFAAYVLIEKGERDALEDQRKVDERAIQSIGEAIHEAPNYDPTDDCFLPRKLRELAGPHAKDLAESAGDRCGDLH